MGRDYSDIILRFFRDDVKGILITGADGQVLYTDEKADRIYREAANWKAACPPPRAGQRGEAWDLPYLGGRGYMVTTSSFSGEEGTGQIHFIMDSSVYMELFRDMSAYSRTLKEEKDRDGLTGLNNKGKLMEMKQSLFKRQEAIAVFCMDLNFLKRTNDTLGHEAGDKLILKAAESLRRIEARNVMPFRVGGDEFIVVALHVRPEEAEALKEKWAEGLAELNRKDDGPECVIACGMACGGKGCDFDELFARADALMYEDKKAIKARRAAEDAAAGISYSADR
jgi:diguanylate cyclase (GGDEF)-like protein